MGLKLYLVKDIAEKIGLRSTVVSTIIQRSHMRPEKMKLKGHEIKYYYSFDQIKQIKKSHKRFAERIEKRKKLDPMFLN